MKILFATSEAAPFVRSGGLGDVAGALPQALMEKDVEVRVILPYYSDISEEYKHTFTYLGNIFVPLSWRKVYCGVFMGNVGGVTYYFIDNEYYFKRNGLYGHFDDAERFAFFSRAVLATMQITDYYPDIVHCNDWHTGLVPVFLDGFYSTNKKYANMRTIFTIHNIEFQGKYGREILHDIIGLPHEKASLIDYSGCVNFMKGGIEAAHIVNTVSPTYAKEILDPFFAYGLEDILRARKYKIRGVVNGIDTKLYNPSTDKALFAPFSSKATAGKKKNKKGLCEMLNIPYSEERPMIAMVTRLSTQKGIDIIGKVLDELLSRDITLVVLGTGEWRYETLFKEAEKKFPAKMRFISAFSFDIAEKFYAASDMFLMPSKYEPCGLSQLIAMRYGSVPIVRETGGLKDTVEPFNTETMSGTGFTFKSFDAYDMLDAIDRAIIEFKVSTTWKKIVKSCMIKDISWNKSAEEYLKIYDEISLL